MKFDHRVDLAAEKAAAKVAIDNAAEKIRAKFITLGSGQSMVYAEKEKEAEALIADSNISPGLIPHIIAEAQLSNVTPFEKAVEIITMANQWRQVSAFIETTRLAAKAAIDVSNDYKVIRSIPVNIDWSPVMQYV